MQIKTKYQKLIAEIERVSRLKARFDQYGAGHGNPKKISVKNAKIFAERLYKVGKCDLPLPSVSLDEKGYLELEWWVGQEKLSLHVQSKHFLLWDVDPKGHVVQEKSIALEELLKE